MIRMEMITSANKISVRNMTTNILIRPLKYSLEQWHKRSIYSIRKKEPFIHSREAPKAGPPGAPLCESFNFTASSERIISLFKEIQANKLQLRLKRSTVMDHSRNIDDYLVWAILATIFCCLPFGIVAIVYAAQAKGHLSSGDLEAAEETSSKARKWCLAATLTGLGVGLIYLLISCLSLPMYM